MEGLGISIPTAIKTLMAADKDISSMYRINFFLLFSFFKGIISRIVTNTYTMNTDNPFKNTLIT